MKELVGVELLETYTMPTLEGIVLLVVAVSSIIGVCACYKIARAGKSIGERFVMLVPATLVIGVLVFIAYLTLQPVYKVELTSEASYTDITGNYMVLEQDDNILCLMEKKPLLN